MIPEAAVEAAARVMFDQSWAPTSSWADVRIEYCGLMRASLEAAAPHMLREAWDDGHSAGVDHADGLDGGSNPYD